LNKDCEDKDLKNDMNKDHNKIIQIIIIKYLFKTFRMILIIGIFAYYIGIVSFILFEVVYRYQQVYMVDGVPSL
jgi:hypothetical protein